MKYLKRTISDGVVDYIPLDNAEFHFCETDDNEYRVELQSVSGRTITLFEKKCIYKPSMDDWMRNIAMIPDGQVIELEELF